MTSGRIRGKKSWAPRREVRGAVRRCMGCGEWILEGTVLCLHIICFLIFDLKWMFLLNSGWYFMFYTKATRQREEEKDV